MSHSIIHSSHSSHSSHSNASNHESYQVTFELPDNNVVTITVRRDEFILDAARQAGLILPSLCERGWCLTCAVKVLSGNIDQSDSARFYDVDQQAGFALICTGKPRSDLRLRPGAIEEMRRHRDAHHLPAPRGTGATSPILYIPPDTSQRHGGK